MLTPPNCLQKYDHRDPIWVKMIEDRDVAILIFDIINAIVTFYHRTLLFESRSFCSSIVAILLNLLCDRGITGVEWAYPKELGLPKLV